MPEFAGRSCADCSRYVYGPNGEASRVGDEPDATPMRLADYGEAPPCGRCPKVAPGGPAEPLPPDRDLYAHRGFWDVLVWARERQVLGLGFADADPLMRAVAAEVLAADRRAERRQLAGDLADAVAAAFRRR